MRLLQCIGSLAIALATLASSQQFDIPQMQRDVDSILDRFYDWTQYHGPTAPAAPVSTPVSYEPPITRPSVSPSYWLEQIKHQGVAAFNSNTTYKVFRNVKDFGAKGDGVTDDTFAIQSAIINGNRCAPNICQPQTFTPAVVYFPSGTYLISKSIIDYYYTQMIGNPINPPVLKATPGFAGFGLIDGDYNGTDGDRLSATDSSYRQIRNFVIDMSSIPSDSSATGIHWSTAGATSIQNVVFWMSDMPGTLHQGLFIESGSAGLLTDLVFHGGLYGANIGNQQYTMRNLTFYNAATAINILYNWSWTLKSITIQNCTLGLDMTSGGHDAQAVGSITFIDSAITNTPVGFNISHDLTSKPATGGSTIIGNLILQNVPVAVMGPKGKTILLGTKGSAIMAVPPGVKGHVYTPNGPRNVQGRLNPFARPESLLKEGKYYERSKPQYENVMVTQFLSVREFQAKGDGITDDTRALQWAVDQAAIQRRILFVDAGTYRVTSTINFPPGSKIIGESYAVILSSGSYFSNISKPNPVIQVGLPGQSGSIEWSDMIVSTQGFQPGAILIQYNLATPPDSPPSGIWDVHTRIGGFVGSNLQVTQCPKIANASSVNTSCIAAYTSLHITSTASNLLLENNWFRTADRDLDSPTLDQITVYTGRGVLVESLLGTIWLYGTAVDHHSLYQYQFSNTKNIFAGMIQTETAYWQTNLRDYSPLAKSATLSDLDFAAECEGTVQGGQCTKGWGLRTVNSTGLRIHGAGLQSSFNDYNPTCSNNTTTTTTTTQNCQSRIFDIQGTTTDLQVYNLNTLNAKSMIDHNGISLAKWSDNINAVTDTIALFQL